MKRSFAQLEQMMGTILGRWGAKVEPIRKGAWALTPRIPLNLEKDIKIEAELKDQWAMLRVPIEDDSPNPDLWKYFKAGSALDGNSKVTFDVWSRTLEVREDVPITDDDDFMSRCEHGLKNVMDASLRVYLHVRGISRPQGKNPPPPTIEQPIEFLKGALSETEWIYSEKRGGELTVDLSVPSSRHLATVTYSPDSAWRLSVQTARHKKISESSKPALALLMLSANLSLRLARAGIHDDANAVCTFFEVRFFAPPSASLLDHALNALSVAVSLFGKEAKALEDESVARRYLELRGWSPCARPSPAGGGPHAARRENAPSTSKGKEETYDKRKGRSRARSQRRDPSKVGDGN